jgi:hypothetical protein
LLDIDRLTDEAQEYLKAFPSMTAKSLRLRLWDVVRNEDWGFRTVDSLTDWSGRNTTTSDVVWWIGTDTILGFLVFVVFIVPPVWVRNQFVKPAYTRRIAAAVDDVLPQRAR